MLDLKEQAKKLLMKGHQLKDPDIINMAIEMLDNCSNSESPPSPKESRGSVEITDDFKMQGASGLRSRYGRKVQIPIEKRENSFVDDLTEAVADIGETPKLKKRAKKAPRPKKVSIKCRTCGVVKKVPSTIVLPDSEGYRCDDCILEERKS